MFGRPDDPTPRRRRRPSLWVGEPPPEIQRNAGARPTRNWLAGKAGYSASCHVCILDVDPETGEVEIVRYVVGHEVDVVG